MNFTLTPNHDLVIEATTAKEVAEICTHFNLDVTKHTDELIEGRMIQHVSGAKRPWFHLFQDVPFEFLQPYYGLLEKVTGYAGPAFEIAAPRYPGGHCVNLRHTHLVADAAIGATGYHAECFIQAEDWDGQPAAQRAVANLAGYLRDALGATKQEPEYLQAGNNHMVRNPNYLTRHAPHPAATSVKLFETIFNHWLACHATTAQFELWDKGDDCHRTVCKTESLAASMLRNYSNSFHVENYNSQVTFDEFKAAGKEVA